MPNIRQMLHLFAARNVHTVEMGITTLVDRIRSGNPMSFARYGDGEWSAILGRDGENCDGHKYSKSLQNGLRETILDKPSYDIGMQYVALKSMGRDISRFIKKENLEYHWWNADIFHDANLNGTLFPFIDLLRNSRTIVIGPDYLKELSLFSPIAFIEIPKKNCFDAYDSIFADIETIAEREPSGCIFLFSASMASNVLIHNLFKKYGEKHSFLDIGSLWDVYVGKISRGVYHEYEWTDLLRRNSGEIMGKSVLFYNLFPKTTWKTITQKILSNVPHDEIIVHITLPKMHVFNLYLIKMWLTTNFPKITKIIWSFNTKGMGETTGFNLLRKKVDLSGYSILTYSHSKGSSRKRKNTPPIQDWTELMRYYVVEHLDMAKREFEKGKWCSGVNLQQATREGYNPDIWHYSGNFVSIHLDSCRSAFLSTLCKSDYYGVELFWGSFIAHEKMAELHHSGVDHYNSRYPSTMFRT